MDQLIYSINLNGVLLQLEENNLGYCFSLEHHGHTDIFTYANLDESLDMMEYAINYMQSTF